MAFNLKSLLSTKINKQNKTATKKNIDGFEHPE